MIDANVDGHLVRSMRGGDYIGDILEDQPIRALLRSRRRAQGDAKNLTRSGAYFSNRRHHDQFVGIGVNVSPIGWSAGLERVIDVIRRSGDNSTSTGEIVNACATVLHNPSTTAGLTKPTR